MRPTTAKSRRSCSTSQRRASAPIALALHSPGMVASKYLVAALQESEERLRQEHRRLRQATFCAVPDQERLPV